MALQLVEEASKRYIGILERNIFIYINMHNSKKNNWLNILLERLYIEMYKLEYMCLKKCVQFLCDLFLTNSLMQKLDENWIKIH